MSQQLEAVKRLFEIVEQPPNARNASVLEMYHPEIVIHEAPSLPYGGDYHGHRGAIEHVYGYYRTWEALKSRELLEEAVREHPPIVLDTS